VTGGSAVLRPVSRPGAECVLVCMGYSGGGTTSFRRWARVLPESVELALVCYPGREARFNTPLVHRWDDLLADVTSAVRPLTERPYLLFGHSLGGWVAFEVAAGLERAGAAPPEALVISSCVAPADWRNRHERAPSPTDTDSELLTWMSEVGQLPAAVLAEPDLREMAVELLRADMDVSYSYRYQPGVRTRVPTQVLHGRDDHLVPVESVRRWRLVTSGAYQVDELPGGHFYTDEVWERLPERFAALRGVWPSAGDSLLRA
jgi:surfactin synthase thioesterase subunit